MSRLKNIVKRSKSHKVLIENFSYLAFLQVFLLLYPLITYPYLVDVLGKEIYGIVLTAQMLASYASLFIDFGSNFVCAKHVSINRDNKAKLSEILSNVLFVRLVIFIIFFFIYSFVAYIVPSYRSKFLIFILTYAFCTNDLLFPQFFFQGLERMKIITIVNVTTKVVMVMLIFVIVKKQEDAFLVPIIYSFGYFVGGFISLYLIVFKMKIKLVCPNLKSSILYIKDSSSIFATDIICAIKDKLSYLLVGTFVGMSDVVIYDLGLKLHGIVAKPYMLICTVMFPRLAKNRSIIHSQNILVTGANGQLGNEMRIVSKNTSDNYIFTDVNQVEGLETTYLDITDIDAIRKMVKDNNVNAIVNCAAWTNVDACETDEKLAALAEN